jgi:hypothetical protein
MMTAMPYPISATFERELEHRNRLTTLFRLILAIPHLILVGAVGLGLAVNNQRHDLLSFGSETGLLGSIALALAIVSWFTIVITSEHYSPIRRYTRYYLRWRVRALAYLMLLTDRYPPFGDDAYPAALTFDDPGPYAPRDRLTVALRLIVGLPQFVVLFFVCCAWWVTTAIAWFLILFTGRYPQGLYDFGAGALRWLIRVEAYLLLMVDDYPPFSLS